MINEPSNPEQSENADKPIDSILFGNFKEPLKPEHPKNAKFLMTVIESGIIKDLSLLQLANEYS